MENVHNNLINLIFPYKWNGMWVFDDDRVGLIREPFVSGADVMIDMAIKLMGIKNANEGFVLVFSDFSFSDAHIRVDWVREEGNGNVYKWDLPDGSSMEGWLCPALFRYYSEAPKKMHLQFKEVTLTAVPK